MKKQAPLVLSIPQPCTQSWEEMSATGSGRFCSHCRHSVTDISGMSDSTVHHLFQQGNLRCVRALSSQLNRQIALPPQKPTHLYRIAIAFGLMLMMASGAEAYARPKAPLTDQNFLLNTGDSTFKDGTDGDSIVISGVVLDETDQPFAGVIVKLIQGGLLKGGTFTEDDGTFSLTVKRRDYELEFCSTSYKTIKHSIAENSVVHNIVMKMELGDVVYLGQLILPIPPERNKELRPTIIEDEELRRMGY